jgi:hypothetical protein
MCCLAVQFYGHAELPVMIVEVPCPAADDAS